MIPVDESMGCNTLAANRFSRCRKPKHGYSPLARVRACRRSRLPERQAFNGTIGRPLARHALDCFVGTILIVYTQRATVAVPEVKLGKVADWVTHGRSTAAILQSSSEMTWKALICPTG
jgi:hypothetical protein